MRLEGMDLKLFVAFETSMETRNTARAGERVGTEPTGRERRIGAAARLFQDDLRVQKGRCMFPTPLAEVAAGYGLCLHDAEAVLVASSVFDPAAADRRFRVASSDHVTS